MNRILWLAVPVAGLSLGLLSAQTLTPEAIHEITLRNIPGTLSSGRIADVAVNPKNRNIWYVATASGGLWRTNNHGLTFQPIFDDGGSYSLGCVTVDPRNSDIVWLGAGENESQRAIGWGDGVYGSKTGRKVDKWPGVPDMTYVTDVHPSTIDVNTVFVTLNDFQRGNLKPYVMKSTDLGRIWTSITGDLPANDPAWTIVQDHINPNLWFAGTEFGLSFTIDGGCHWIKFRNGMPPVPIRDLEIQKRESYLAAASFGRGFFILDNYSPLRQLTPQALESEGALFAPGRKARVYQELGYYRAEGDNLGSPNPPFGAILSYYLREDVPTPANAEVARVILQIADASGRTVRQLDESGVHRVAWDPRESPVQTAPAASSDPAQDVRRKRKSGETRRLHRHAREIRSRKSGAHRPAAKIRGGAVRVVESLMFFQVFSVSSVSL
jgi:hypothetical protein